jgi:hypothetical protein
MSVTSESSEYTNNTEEEIYSPTGFENMCLTINGSKYYIDFSSTSNGSSFYYKMYQTMSKFMAPTTVLIMNTDNMSADVVATAIMSYWFSDMALPVMGMTYAGNYMYSAYMAYTYSPV